MSEYLIVLGKDRCSGCVDLKNKLILNDIDFRYVTDEKEIEKYRKNGPFDFYPHAIVINQNNDIIDIYPYSNENTNQIIQRFKKRGSSATN